MSDPAPERIHCLRPLTRHDLGGEVPSGDARDQITRAIVSLIRARTGRGPTRGKTEVSTDLALVSLRDCLTTAERTLVDEGHGDLVVEMRAALHDGMRSEAIAAVEAITGRVVTAYLTAHEQDPDLSLIAFHFAPPADPRLV